MVQAGSRRDDGGGTQVSRLEGESREANREAIQLGEIRKSEGRSRQREKEGRAVQG